jgi:hypothetical protein
MLLPHYLWRHIIGIVNPRGVMLRGHAMHGGAAAILVNFLQRFVRAGIAVSADVFGVGDASKMMRSAQAVSRCTAIILMIGAEFPGPC